MERIPRVRTYTLTERAASLCRLTPADVEFLLGEHRGHVEVAPTGRRGFYQITPLGHVGTIAGPTCRLLIQPKIPLSNLFHLLDPAGDVPAVEDQTAAKPGGDVLDFLVGRLTQMLLERAGAGLHRGYRERDSHDRFLQGQLDVAAQVRDTGVLKDHFHCRHEEFTADVPCNQIPRATAEWVLGSHLIGEPVRAALRQALTAFADVSPIDLGSESFDAAHPDRLTEAYRPLLNLCRLLVDALAVGKRAGPVTYPAFLLDMEQVFERYVTAGVLRGFATDVRSEVAVQPLYVANRPVHDQPDIPLRPDVVVHRAGRPVLVVDAKWKAPAGSPLVTADLYQMLSYCTILGVRRGVLVYPGRKDRRWSYVFNRVPLRLEIQTLRVTGSRQACTRSLNQLGRLLRRKARLGAAPT